MNKMKLKRGGCGLGTSNRSTPASESQQETNQPQRVRNKQAGSEMRQQRSRASRKFNNSGLKVSQINTQEHNNLGSVSIRNYRSNNELNGTNTSSKASKSISNDNKTSTTYLTNKQGSNYTCSGCNQAIKDKYLLNACNKFWHDNCLKCDRCQAKLGELGSTLYEKANMNLCRQDYFEMFGQKAICAVCDKLIYASEMVMRAKENVYHLECFACQLCGLRFCVGDRFHLCENKIVCQYDYDEHILPIQESMQQLDQQQRQQQQQQGQQHDSNSLDATNIQLHDSLDSNHYQEAVAPLADSVSLLSAQAPVEVESHTGPTSTSCDADELNDSSMKSDDQEKNHATNMDYAKGGGNIGVSKEEFEPNAEASAIGTSAGGDLIKAE